MISRFGSILLKSLIVLVPVLLIASQAPADSAQQRSPVIRGVVGGEPASFYLGVGPQRVLVRYRYARPYLFRYSPYYGYGFRYYGRWPYTYGYYCRPHYLLPGWRCQYHRRPGLQQWRHPGWQRPHGGVGPHRGL